MSRSALEGIRVLDLTRVAAGPFCAKILADLGAEVIKVELPGIGEEARTTAPFIKGESSYYQSFNRNKKGITLNLRKQEGQRILKDLVKFADVVVENFSPGTMDEFGLGYNILSEINPRIILASISGFGQKNSPYVKKVSYDIVAQAIGGLMSVTGMPDGSPTKVGTSIGDLTGGLFATIGITAALYEREQSGQGQAIDVALADSIFSLLEHAVERYTASGEVAGRIGNRHPALCPFNTYKCKDGEVAIGTASNPVAIRFAQAIGRNDWAEDPNFNSSNAIRVQNSDKIESVLEEWCLQHTKAEIVKTMDEYDVPCGPVNTIADAVKEPHFTERGMLVDVEHPVAGTFTVVGPTIKLSRTPCQVLCAGPMLGQHNDEIYKGLLNMSDEEINRLKEERVI